MSWKVAAEWSLAERLMSRHRVGSLRFSTTCSFNSVSLLVTGVPPRRSTHDSRTIRACAKSWTDSWSPFLLAKNFHVAWVSVSCSLKTSLKIMKTTEGEDHWDVGLSFTSPHLPGGRSVCPLPRHLTGPSQLSGRRKSNPPALCHLWFPHTSQMAFLVVRTPGCLVWYLRHLFQPQGGGRCCGLG